MNLNTPTNYISNRIGFDFFLNNPDCWVRDLLQRNQERAGFPQTKAINTAPVDAHSAPCHDRTLYAIWNPKKKDNTYLEGADLLTKPDSKYRYRCPCVHWRDGGGASDFSLQPNALAARTRLQHRKFIEYKHTSHSTSYGAHMSNIHIITSRNK